MRKERERTQTYRHKSGYRLTVSAGTPVYYGHNDTEGFHNRLNYRTPTHNLGLYFLILHTESLKVTMVCDELLPKKDRQHNTKQSRLSNLWDDYEIGLINTSDFLSRCQQFLPGFKP